MRPLPWTAHSGVVDVVRVADCLRKKELYFVLVLGNSRYSIGPNIRIPIIRKSALSGHEILVPIFSEIRHRIKIISLKKIANRGENRK